MSLDPSDMTTDEAREHLARLGVTQDGFAKLIHVNPSTFRRWLNPDSGWPMPRSVQLLLRKLSVTDIRHLIAADTSKP